MAIERTVNVSVNAVTGILEPTSERCRLSLLLVARL